MERYNPLGTNYCSKCGHKSHTLEYVKAEELSPPEHVQLRCYRCGYQWCMKPLDGED